MMKSLFAVLFLAGALIAAGVAWQEHGDIVRLRNAASVGADERADLQKRIWRSEKLAKDLQDQLAAAKGAGGVRSGGGGKAGGQSGSNNRSVEGFIAFLNDPKAQGILQDQQRKLVDRRYAALFKKLDLPPAQLAQFKDLLAERQNAVADVVTGDLQQGITPSQDPDFRQEVLSAQDEVNNKIQAQLGSAAYGQFQGYEDTLLFRDSIANLQKGMNSLTSSSVTDDQTDQFTSGVLTAAQGVFTPAQLQAMGSLEQMAQARQQIDQMRQAYNNSRSGN